MLQKRGGHHSDTHLLGGGGMNRNVKTGAAHRAPVAGGRESKRKIPQQERIKEREEKTPTRGLRDEMKACSEGLPEERKTKKRWKISTGSVDISG